MNGKSERRQRSKAAVAASQLSVASSCKWFKADGNERFSFFSSCGNQFEYVSEKEWDYCPKCGGKIDRSALQLSQGEKSGG